ncbi:MAG TPA: cell division protein FtsQ, partial [Alcaligenes faecalis]|nr:cell division protein FtsQ [Alcaligenes faecalis]
MFSDARLTNLIANTLALLAVSALVISVVVWAVRRPYFNIERIQIESSQGERLA